MALSSGLLLLLTAGFTYAQYDPNQAANPPGLNVQMSRTVVAGATATVSLDASAIPTDIVYNHAAAFRVRLYNSVANWPICTLLETTAQQPSSFQVTIPNNVGPAGAYYALALDYVENDAIDNLVTSIGGDNPINPWSKVEDKFSNLFFLSSPANEASGWSSYETTTTQRQLQQVGGLFLYESNSTIPCTSYSCVRACAELYPPPKPSQDPASATYDAAYLKCVGACQGVRLPPNPKTTGDPNAPPSSLLTPPLIDDSCSAADFRTPCGSACCARDEICLPWGTCVAAPSAAAAQESAIPTVTPTPTRPGFDIGSMTTMATVPSGAGASTATCK